MKKILLTLCLFVISSNVLAIAPPGSGTEEDPYQLSEDAHLLWLSGKSGFCQLVSDIDASDIKGSKWFSGTIDGSGHEVIVSATIFPEMYGTLKNIKLSGGTFCGEFEGTINNVQLDDCLLAKGIYNSFIHSVRLLNCSLAGVISGSTCDGITIDGKILKEQFSKYSYLYKRDNIYERVCIGGLAGYGSKCNLRNIRSNIDFDFFNGTIGGIIGICNSLRISTSCYLGSINGSGVVGGIIGLADVARDLESYTTVQNCYFDLTHAAANGYGTGVNPAELRRQETFEHWDFENVWEIEEGFSYPTLRDSSSSGTKTIISQGLSIAGISIKGKLSDEELNEIKENPTICLYSEGAGAEITARQELQESKPSSFSYKSKEEAVSISYSSRSKSLKFSSASPQITLGKSSDEGFAPCKLSDCSMKLTSSMTIIKDISEHLRQNGKLSLYDSEIFGNVLGGTTVELKQKGNNLSYKGANGDVKITCKINLKNKMIQIKYISNNVIQPVILCEKK